MCKKTDSSHLPYSGACLLNSAIWWVPESKLSRLQHLLFRMLHPYIWRTPNPASILKILKIWPFPQTWNLEVRWIYCSKFLFVLLLELGLLLVTTTFVFTFLFCLFSLFDFNPVFTNQSCNWVWYISQTYNNIINKYILLPWLDEDQLHTSTTF